MPSEIDLFLEYINAQEDMTPGQPATEQEIAEFEARYGVKLPADVREYFLKIMAHIRSADLSRLRH